MKKKKSRLQPSQGYDDNGSVHMSSSAPGRELSDSDTRRPSRKLSESAADAQWGGSLDGGLPTSLRLGGPSHWVCPVHAGTGRGRGVRGKRAGRERRGQCHSHFPGESPWVPKGEGSGMQVPPRPTLAGGRSPQTPVDCWSQ